MNKQGGISNVLLIMLAAGIVLTTLISTISNPTITGFTIVGSEKISQDLMDKINIDGQADVIVLLKKDTSSIHGQEKQTLEIKQQNIKKVQNKVLSKLNYIERDQLLQAKKENRDLKQLLKNKDFAVNYIYSSTNALSGILTKEGLIKLEADEFVSKILPVSPINVNLAGSVPLINADDVWGIKVNNNITGLKQSICILDTGANYSHEMLGSCTFTQVQNHNCKVIAGYDFVNDDSNPMDDNGHGTHVSGIAAGNGSLKGVAKLANIVSIKVLNSGGSGTDADLIAGIDWCVNNATKYNISVISMSLGDDGHYTASNCPVVMNETIITATEAGISVFAASGNEDSTTGINWPSCSPFLISVGSSNDDDTMSSFTNSYSGLDVVAPGNTIVSANYEGGTASDSGTSMATPHAAGVAAMIYQYEKELNNRNATQSEVKNLLKMSTISVTRGSLSFKRIDALESINNIVKLNTTDNFILLDEVQVKFTTSTNLENVSGAFIMGRNFISLNASKFPEYNKTSNITFYNVSYSKNPILYKNNERCSNCRVLSLNPLMFNVTGFSNYSSAANARLEIFNQLDVLGGSRIAKSNFQTYFFANYTNQTSKKNISNANCTIRFSDSFKNMTFNTSSNLFEYNRTFYLSQYYNYNVTCIHNLYEPLNTTDTIYLSPACINQTPNTDLVISSSSGLNCTGETITLKNQSLFIYGSLILNNTILKMEVSGTSVDNISVLGNANLTIYNSILNCTLKDSGIFAKNRSKIKIINSKSYNFSIDLNGNSTTNTVNATFNHVTKKISMFGDSISRFNESIFRLDLSLESKSRTFIKNSNLSKNISFLQHSYAEMSNVSIAEIKQLGTQSIADTATLNFTSPTSRINKIKLIKLNSTISGYVNMSSYVVTYTVPNVNRFYPVQVNYTDGTPAASKFINITNISNKVVLWSGYTDANGLANPNLTFKTGSKALNYTIKANPAKNISLLTDTPIILTLSDTTPPIVSRIKPNISNEDVNVNYNATVSDDIGLNKCNLTIDGINNGSMTIIGSWANRTVNIATPGLYNFLANCSDTSGNYNDTEITPVRIRDVTKPFFNQTPINKNTNEGTSFIRKINATDNVKLDDYRLNDNINFTINKETGLIKNNTALLVGLYRILITINDTSNNINTTRFNLTVIDITPPRIINISNTSITNQSTLINWTTNEAANTTIHYGINASLGTKITAATLAILHTKLASVLKNGTKYYYNVTSCSGGGCALNGTLTFTTKQNTAPTPVSDSPGGGGGGSSTVLCTSLWLCDAWNDCINGQQVRLCEDLNGCLIPKTETQACTVKASTPKPKTSGIINTTNEGEIKTPTMSAILETPKSNVSISSYMIFIWLILGLLILLFLGRRIDTFPLVVWEEERYLKKDKVEKAEKLFDKLVKRFGRSKERERKYVSKVENIALNLENLEKTKKTEKKDTSIKYVEHPSFKKKVYKETTKTIYKETQDLSYKAVFDEYKGALEQYLSLPPEQRKQFEDKIETLRKKVLELSDKKGSG